MTLGLGFREGQDRGYCYTKNIAMKIRACGIHVRCSYNNSSNARQFILQKDVLLLLRHNDKCINIYSVIYRLIRLLRLKFSLLVVCLIGFLCGLLLPGNKGNYLLLWWRRVFKLMSRFLIKIFNEHGNLQQFIKKQKL